MTRLDQLEAQSIYILREAYARVKPWGMLWSLGKDSNVMVWLARKAFYGRVPFPVLLLDTGNELDEVYRFRDEHVVAWNLDYIDAVCPPIEETDPTLPTNSRHAARKTLGLANAIAEHGFKGLFLGIRRDEQAVRSKERVFSPRDESGAWDYRDQPAEFWDQYRTRVPPGAHLRIHPLLPWTEVDIWRYIQREGIPVVPLYFARDGWRYRSLGEKDITKPIRSTAASIDDIIAELEITRQPERAGRTMDHDSEDAFERLRATGYM